MGILKDIKNYLVEKFNKDEKMTEEEIKESRRQHRDFIYQKVMEEIDNFLH